MKRFFIVHRWDGSSDGDWYPWIKKELEKKGWFVNVLDMPNSEKPVIADWVEYLAEAIGTPDKDTYLIGHSIGCQTILRYIEQLGGNDKIGGAVFVAGWFTLGNLESDEERAIAEPWLQTPIDFERLKRHLVKSHAIFSDNDPFVPISNIKLFEKQVGSYTRLESHKGHFTSLDKVDEVPSVLEAVLNVSDAPSR